MKETRFCLFLMLIFLIGCADDKTVNAVFFQNQVSWFVFDATHPGGLEPLKSFDETKAPIWKPRFRAAVASDLLYSEAIGKGAVGVSGLGLIVLDDTSGPLVSSLPASALDWSGYRTGILFVDQKRFFLQVFQETELGIHSPSVTLAWWAEGQMRLAFYPIPSQVQNPGRQAVGLEIDPSSQGSTSLNIRWKNRGAEGWSWIQSTFSLENGAEQDQGEGEAPAMGLAKLEPLPDLFNNVRERLSARLGNSLGAVVSVRIADVPTMSRSWANKSGSLHVVGAVGVQSVLLLAENGLAAVSTLDRSDVRLYRLPELGNAGRYTAAIAMKNGFVVSWEMAFRGYVGEAGLVYIPYGVLAP